MTTITKDFCYRNEHFTIVYDGRFYMTVNHKYIKDGRTIKELRFNDLHPGTTVMETLNLVKQDLDMKYFESQGLSKAESYAKVCNIPIEIAEMIFTPTH